ncbi:MAG: hypothetical protein ACFNLD_07505 [Kingella oralis]
MLNTPALLLSSIIWSLLWMIFVAITVRHFPWTMAHDYPPDMQQATVLPAPNPAQKRHAALFTALAFTLRLPLSSPPRCWLTRGAAHRLPPCFAICG